MTDALSEIKKRDKNFRKFDAAVDLLATRIVKASPSILEEWRGVEQESMDIIFRLIRKRVREIRKLHESA